MTPLLGNYIVSKNSLYSEFKGTNNKDAFFTVLNQYVVYNGVGYKSR